VWKSVHFGAETYLFQPQQDVFVSDEGVFTLANVEPDSQVGWSSFFVSVFGQWVQEPPFTFVLYDAMLPPLDYHHQHEWAEEGQLPDGAAIQ
jgi:hypothetical protein